MNKKNLTNFFFELGQLKRIKHEGWRIIGVEAPESVAEHSLRAAQIGYLLAEMEGYKKPEEVVTMIAFHDIGECRIGDLHKVASRYVEADEEKAVKEQTKPLKKTGEKILDMWKKVEKQSTKAGQIAKDADYLEQAVTAREYMEIGHKKASDWIKNISKRLKTKSAKQLLTEIKKTNPNTWWQGLKKV
ncbi:HD domain-containing protein [Candidatus Peregrinibacteria bacterium]|jgi:putative hydrolases of HD superfamily|nr:HD domain-containing protein [Candidatus Peregrinibacteria bacterium]MBT7737072.1 HD domain-containing protein [Candidatus Peregrinibacteria bacterium]